MQGLKLTGLTVLDYLIGNELGPALGMRADMATSDSGFPDAELTWLISAHEVPCGIAIFRWQYHVAPSAHQMVSVQ